MSNKKYTTPTRKADFKDDDNYFRPEKPPKNLPELLQRDYRKRLRKYGVPTDEKFGPGVINPYDYMEKKKKKRYYDV